MKRSNSDWQLPQTVETLLFNRNYEQARMLIYEEATRHNNQMVKKDFLNSLRPVHEHLYNRGQWDACCVLEEAAEQLLGDIQFFNVSY